MLAMQSPTNSLIKKSSVEGLFKGARNDIFGDDLTLGVTKDGKQTSMVKLSKFGFAGGIKGGFYDMDKSELDLKNGDWQLKASLKKLEAEKKNPFGLDKNLSVRLGQETGKASSFQFSYGHGSMKATAKTDLTNHAVNCSGSAAGVDFGADVAFSSLGSNPNFLLGASYKLPFSSNPHLGVLVNQTQDFSIGLYGDATIPGVNSATLGAQFYKDTSLMLGAKFNVQDIDVIARASLPQLKPDGGNFEISLTKDIGVKLSAGLRVPLGGGKNEIGFEVEMKK